MEKDKGSIETNKAVCGPAVPPNREVNQSSNEGQPRVGELFFIHQEVDNVSLSSMSSDPTAYTETEIEENLTDYPLSVNYALSITAASVHSSVSSVTQNGSVPKKFNSRSILTAFRKNALSDRIGSSAGRDNDAFPGSIPKTWYDKDPTVNKSADPTIDIENQPSQEESSSGSAADEGSVPSKAHSSLSSFSDGFGGYVYQNCSELNSRKTRLLIMTAAVLLIFGVSAVVAAIVLDGNPANAEAGSKQPTSLYDSLTAEISSNSSEAPQTAFESPMIGSTPTIVIDNSTTPTITPTFAPTNSSENASNDGILEWALTDISTTEATESTVNPSTTEATTSSTMTSTTTTSTPVATTSSSTTSAPTTSTLTTTTTTTTTSSSTTSPPSKLTATYIQAVANSLLSLSLASSTKAKADKEDDKEDNKEDNKGKDDVASGVNVETVVRFDISSMLNDPRGDPFKVLMRQSSNNERLGKISLDYLPKAGLWDCSPCEQAQVPSENSVAVGTFDDSGYLDISLAFSSRGIFNNQMTFKLSSEMFPAPEMVVLWVEGKVDEFSDLSVASLMEKVSEDEDLFN